MDNYSKNISVLEKKLILLLNKLKENHLELNKMSIRINDYKQNELELKNKFIKIKNENNSLKIANNLLGNSESKIYTKRKINKIINEIDKCINSLSEIKEK
ncbi:MAG: hypothetical protein ACJ0NC_03005 [Candidatus Marivariicella sp.]|nr:hypothetical protein [Flavobacteriaceae bacterium]OUV50421.1 MAG: hypothetical protein CBC76_02415 [Flavobacteriaceae bacterium TMED116]|tara:strand:- start:195 stop:497 length:303 start_codon:yes stop_codon:yes gene_type:complete